MQEKVPLDVLTRGNSSSKQAQDIVANYFGLTQEIMVDICCNDAII